MTAIITAAVRAACFSPRCHFPSCECEDANAIAGAARHAAEAVREAAAQVIDRANKEGPYNAIGAARRIRAISLEDETP